MNGYAMKSLKGTGRILVSSSVLTLLLLLYVHGQVSLFRLSYQIDDEADKVVQKTEAYRRLRFEIDQLRAPRRLEKKINDLSMDLALPKEIQVIKMPASSPQALPEIVLNQQLNDSFQQRFSSWVNRWVGVAQAKTEN